MNVNTFTLSFMEQSSERAFHYCIPPGGNVIFLWLKCPPRIYNELGLGQNGASQAAEKTPPAQLIAVGETKPDGKLNLSKLAARTMVANLVLNLDEVMNKG